MAYNFPPSLRLKTATQFKQIFHKAYKLSGTNFVILARLNSLSHPRLGIIIANRNVKTAIARNRLKRIIRDSFRLQQHNIPGVDIIVLGYKGLDKARNEELHTWLEKKWQQLACFQAKL